MKVLLVGSGGRENAIAKKLLQSKLLTELYVAPSNDGIKAHAVNIKASDFIGLTNFAVDNHIDYVVVSPDEPLVMGLVDRMNEKGIPCFGPNKSAAIIEGSKVFTKNLMKEYNIPTASYETFDDETKALEYLRHVDYPTVIKADGLAAGKGALIVDNYDQAQAELHAIMSDKVFGESGNNVVIEEFMQGVEMSLFAFTDGKTIIPMVSAMDHKRAYDDDKGLNTGGMGAIAPNPFETPAIRQECIDKILTPTMNAMNAEGRPFKGCLYAGLMLTTKGVKVVEFNCRFGDPETQVVLPLLESDLLEIMLATTNGTLADVEVKFSDKSACMVVMASKGYPTVYQKGFSITIPAELDQYIDYAGVKLVDGKYTTNGGRVLGVVAVEDDMPTAIATAYSRVKQIKCDNIFYRTDIGKRALEKEAK